MPTVEISPFHLQYLIWNLVVKRFLWTLPVFALGYVFLRTSEMVTGGWQVFLSVVFILLTILLTIRVTIIFYTYFTLVRNKKRAELRLTPQGLVGVTSFGKPFKFTKSGVKRVEIHHGKASPKVSIIVNRPTHKFLRRVNAIAYDFYITSDSLPQLRSRVSGVWGLKRRKSTAEDDSVVIYSR